MKSTGTCATNQYIKQINADGSVVCGNVPYHWGVTCSAGQYIERIDSNGTPTCKAATSLVNSINCSAGQFIYRHENGIFSCRTQDDKNVYGKSCAGGKTLTGFSSIGVPICETSTSVLSCVTKSASVNKSAPNGHVEKTVTCDSGYTAVGGGCNPSWMDGRKHWRSYPSGNGWYCMQEKATALGKVYVRCCK